MMLGGVIWGYCATGSVGMATRPVRVMTIDITDAKMGRSMKKRENTVVPQAMVEKGLWNPHHLGFFNASERCQGSRHLFQGAVRSQCGEGRARRGPLTPPRWGGGKD